MTLNLSVEMVYALYCAAKECSPELLYNQIVPESSKEHLREFVDMVEDYAGTNIDKILTEQMEEHKRRMEKRRKVYQ